MTQDRRHIDFAKDYSREGAHTLTAYAAIFRVQALLEDAETLRKALANVRDSEGPFKWFGLDVISYYTVGFVTCLEWHARARLVDLFNHMPEEIKPEDLRSQINHKMLAQMVAEKVTIPELFGAITNIGSADAYMNAFARIFNVLSISPEPWDVVRPIAIRPWKHDMDGPKMNFLDELFRFRNDLVHEIHEGTIGRPWQRNAKDVDDVIHDGNVVLEIIRALEAKLTENAPADFPNLLDAEGYPVSELDRLYTEIAHLEEELSSHFKDDEKSNALWQEALSAARASVELHDELIETAPFFTGTMWIRLRAQLVGANRRRRLDFLRAFKHQIEQMGGSVPE